MAPASQCCCHSIVGDDDDDESHGIAAASCLNGMHLELKSQINACCKCANNVRDRKSGNKTTRKVVHMLHATHATGRLSICNGIRCGCHFFCSFLGAPRTMVLVHRLPMQIEIVNKHLVCKCELPNSKIHTDPSVNQSSSSAV